MKLDISNLVWARLERTVLTLKPGFENVLCMSGMWLFMSQHSVSISNKLSWTDQRKQTTRSALSPTTAPTFCWTTSMACSMRDIWASVSISRCFNCVISKSPSRHNSITSHHNHLYSNSLLLNRFKTRLNSARRVLNLFNNTQLPTLTLCYALLYSGSTSTHCN